jgi:hypothetical protein
VTANLILTNDVDTGKDSGSWTANIASGNAPEGVGTCKSAFTFSGTASGTWSGQLVATLTWNDKRYSFRRGSQCPYPGTGAGPEHGGGNNTSTFRDTTRMVITLTM